METPHETNTRWAMLMGTATLAIGAAVYLANTASLPIGLAHAAEGKSIAAPKAAIVEDTTEQVAIFAGGCFWGVEAVYERVDGVIRVESGYAGGLKKDADYDRVSNGVTRHAEAVRIIYNPSRVSYDTLLHIFFSVAHDPTQLNRQGPDVGPQYRSAIFPTNAAQENAAEAYVGQLGATKSWRRPIVTRIETGEFYPAEDYHQDYMAKNPRSGYILTYDVPKVEALKHLFPNIYRGN